MNRFRSWLRRLYAPEGFRESVVTLLSGSAVALLLSYFAAPILTRLFSPAEFGVSDYFIMVITVLSTFSSLRYEDAVMLPSDDRSANVVFWLSGLLNVITVLLIFIATIFRKEISAALGVEGLAPWFWLLAPTLLLMRFGKLSELWFSRRKFFRPLAIADLSNKTGMVLTRLGAGLGTSLGAGGLILGFSAGSLASAVYYARVLHARARSLLPGRVTIADMRACAIRYRRFPLFSTPAALLNALSSRLPVILLPVYFTMETVGLFGRAFIALAVPLSVVGGAISQVFFVHATEAHREGRLDLLTAKVHDRLVMFGIFPTVLLIFAGPDLFALVFGAEWRTAGIYEQYLAVWFFAAGVASPLTRLFDVLERQRFELIVSLITLVALGAALYAGGRTGSVVTAVALVGLAGTLVRILHIATMMRLAGVQFRIWILPYAKYLSISVALALPVFLLKETVPLWCTGLLSVGVGAVYLSVVLRK